MNRTLRGLAARAGHRGAFLSFLALLDLAVAYSLWVTTPAQRRTLDLFLPWPWWAAVWAATGLACAAGIFARRDRAAFTAAAATKAAWAGVMADTWLAQGVPRGWVPVVIWAAFALTVLLVSSWPEPPPRVPR